MNGTWTWQIPFSLLVGLGGFLAVLLPVLVIQYSRYGRLSPARLLGTAALSVYAVALVAYTLLPLPDGSTCVGRSGAILQPVPLATLTDIADLAATHGPTSSIALFAAAQPVLNVVLFVPLGVLVRAMAGRGITVATLTGLAVSVLVETTQYTGVFGLVGCAYRVADVDDLLTNTAGALLGALLAPVVAGWIPGPAALAALPPRPVTRPRRLLGMALDAMLLSAAPGLLFTSGMLAYALVWALATGSTDVPDPSDLSPLLMPAAVMASALAALLLLVVLPALRGGGASPGQRMVGIAPVWKGRRGTTGQRLLRALPVAGAWALLPTLASLLEDGGVPLLPWVLENGARGIALASVLLVVLTGTRGLSGVLSGAELVDRRAASTSGVIAHR